MRMNLRCVLSMACLAASACSGADLEEGGEEVSSIEQGLCVEQKLTVASATASSVENAGTPASAAIDGNTTTTRWSSAFSDPQWIRLDLGVSRYVNRVVLYWEAAASRDYDIQVSQDGVTFTTVYTDANGNGGVDSVGNLNAVGRYVRIYSRSRTTQYGNSLWEVEVFGDPSPTCAAASCTQNLLNDSGASASSLENANFPATAAIDSNLSTRWSSAYSDPQWLRVDYGARRYFSRVVLRWEAAASRNYDLQVSDDGVNFTTIYNDPNGNGGVDDITGLSARGRYLRMYSYSRTTQWGNSLFEVEAYGDTNPDCGSTSSGPLLPRTVFGQQAFTETSINNVVNNRVFHPQGVIVQRNDTSQADRVYIVDSGNQRILGFSSLGTCSGGSAPGRACTNNPECPGTGATCTITGTRAADIVIGQKDFSSANCNGDNTQSLPASDKTLCLQAYPRTISTLESPEPPSSRSTRPARCTFRTSGTTACSSTTTRSARTGPRISSGVSPTSRRGPATRVRPRRPRIRSV